VVQLYLDLRVPKSLSSRACFSEKEVLGILICLLMTYIEISLYQAYSREKNTVLSVISLRNQKALECQTKY
jgi:hypothetical protein